MHYSNLVLIPKDSDLESAVADAMGPSEEDGGFWDYYQIGGRWSGAFDGYDADNDPANIKPCEICHGTGKRDDALGQRERERNPAYTCNGCNGKGVRPVWPTERKQHAGDIMPVANLTDDHYKKFFRVVAADGLNGGGERYQPWGSHEAGTMFVKLDRPTLAWIQEKYADHLAVVVDNHN